jgi:hypothetical protein
MPTGRAVRTTSAVGRRDLLAASALGVTSAVLPRASAAASTGGLAGPGAADELDPSTVATVAVTGTADGPTEGVRGLATDGTDAFWRRSFTSTIRQVRLDGTFVADHAVPGMPDFFEGNDLAISSGHLFTRGGSDGAGQATLTAVSLTTWSARSVTLPSGLGLPTPVQYFMSGNLLDLPDGRLGAISAAILQGDGTWVSTLRTWSVDVTGGAGDPVVLTHVRDFQLEDTSAWPDDCHGIASDGVHLYRLRFAAGYRVWTLAATGRSPIAFDADCSSGCSGSATFRAIDPVGGWNATYMARDHRSGRYLVGNYNSGAVGQFYLTA